MFRRTVRHAAILFAGSGNQGCCDWRTGRTRRGRESGYRERATQASGARHGDVPGPANEIHRSVSRTAAVRVLAGFVGEL
ncbi:putative lipoprotein [Pseudomonas aeruginosa]|nr:putative lipoprotein [Pseudomonas aeruginosa]RCG89842.1 putative lipoprotein [Pseudomonas aeruginosa]